MFSWRILISVISGYSGYIVCFIYFGRYEKSLYNVQPYAIVNCFKKSVIFYFNEDQCDGNIISLAKHCSDNGEFGWQIVAI